MSFKWVFIVLSLMKWLNTCKCCVVFIGCKQFKSHLVITGCFNCHIKVDVSALHPISAVFPSSAFAALPSFDLQSLSGGSDQITLLVDWSDHLWSTLTLSDPWLCIKVSDLSLPAVFVSQDKSRQGFCSQGPSAFELQGWGLQTRWHFPSLCYVSMLIW